MTRPDDLVRDGAEAWLTDADILSIVLGSGRAARSALKRYGGIADVLDAPLAELEALGNVSSRSALRLRTAAELARRATARPLRRGQPVHCAADVAEAYRPRLAQERRELFVALHLDVKNRVQGERLVAVGHLTSALVHPREVYREAVREAAAAIVVLHGHPSGCPEPSIEDVDITKRLAQAGRILGVPLLDHVVVGAEGHVSLAERGLL